MGSELARWLLICASCRVVGTLFISCWISHCLYSLQYKKKYVRSLYDKNKCVISCGGKLHQGFNITAGIRQGCPLSPLLFAVTVDMLLRRLSYQSPSAVVRAFAFLMVVEDAWESVSDISRLFTQFGQISGLELNIPKTVLIPLWEEPLTVIRTELRKRCQAWEEIEVSGSARYLGFVEGTTKCNKSWTKAGDKFLQAARLWGSQGLGLQYSALTYNTFAISTLTFLSQLEDPPPDIYDLEKRALRRVAPGPGKDWATAEDLWHLQRYGQARSFRSLRVTAWATQIRATAWEAKDDGGLRVAERSKCLDDLLIHTNYSERRWRWTEWYKRSHIATLAAANKRLRSLGGSVSAIKTELANGASLPWSTEVRQRIKSGFQRALTPKMYGLEHLDPVERIRHKLHRWKLLGLPGRNAERVLRNLNELRNLVCPRVAAACFSTVWNRWTTARRSQKRGHPDNRCLLGCSNTAEDSIEHYCRCPVIRFFAGRFLQLSVTSENGLVRFLLASASSTEDKVALTRTAIMVYAAYNTVNCIRHSGRRDLQTTMEMLMQYGKEATRNHPSSTRVIDDWSGNCTNESRTTNRRRRRENSQPPGRAVRSRADLQNARSQYGNSASN